MCIGTTIEASATRSNLDWIKTCSWVSLPIYLLVTKKISKAGSEHCYRDGYSPPLEAN